SLRALGGAGDPGGRPADIAGGVAAASRARARGASSGRVAFAPFRARCRPLLARAHRATGGVRPRPPGAGAAQSLGPLAAACRLPPPLQPSDCTRATGARTGLERCESLVRDVIFVAQEGESVLPCSAKGAVEGTARRK